MLSSVVLNNLASDFAIRVCFSDPDCQQQGPSSLLDEDEGSLADWFRRLEEQYTSGLTAQHQMQQHQHLQHHHL